MPKLKNNDAFLKNTRTALILCKDGSYRKIKYDIKWEM